MLGKLIKTDLKSTARTFLPICAGLMILAIAMIICMVTVSKNDVGIWANTIAGIAFLLYTITLMVFFGLAFIVPLQRFQRCVLKNDAYLMLTIPVKPWMHVVSKLVCSLVWYIAAQICRCIITSIMYARNSEFFTFSAGNLFFGRDDDTKAVFLNTLMSFLNTLLLMIFAQLFLYMVYVLGSMFNKNRNLATVFIAIAGIVLLSWIYGIVLFSVLNSMRASISRGLFYGAMCIFYAVFSVIFYIVTTLLLEKKYDLQ